MKNVAIVSGPVKNCGIHTFASCMHEILQTSTKYKFHFFEVNTAEEMLSLVDTHNVSSVIYNWHPGTSPWCTPEFTKSMTKFNQFLIKGHELYNQQREFDNIKAFITVDPTLPQTENSYPGIRPIAYYDDIQYSPPSKVIKIGTSGFGHYKKGLNKLVDMVNSQFKGEEVELNIHFSIGQFVDPSGGAAKQAIYSALAGGLNENVKLNVCHDFFDKQSLIKWLNNNDINIYCYDYYDGPGVSSSVDKALAAKKPMGINDSNYFKHIRKDSIDVNKTPIKEIISAGIEPLQEFYDKWNSETFLNQYHYLLDKYDA